VFYCTFVQFEDSGAKMHNEKLHTSNFCPDIVSMIRSRKMRQLGHLECMGEKRNA
jgi:hypothetical protein